jgi:uncharacterized protein (DUF427 family)
MFEHDGSQRPDFAEEPDEGQESVWDYPRPPRLDPDDREIVVEAEGQEIARSTDAIRVLETASPPTFYIPKSAINMKVLEQSDHTTHCEWKGKASYWDLKTDDIWIQNAAWSYEMPKEAFRDIKGYLCFYPSKVTCKVDGELVKPQPGNFYGGWMTSEITGPVKGENGSGGW